MKKLEDLSGTNPIDLDQAKNLKDYTVWTRLFVKYNEPLRTVCRRLGVPRDDVDDVVQTVWAELSLQLDAFVYNPKLRFRGYLYWLCRLRSLDRLGWLKRWSLRFVDHSYLESLIDDRDDELPVELRRQLELVEELQRTVSADFHEDTWKAFHLMSIENEPLGEVAAKLGKKRSAVCNANRRVIKRLEEEAAARRLPRRA